MILEVAAKIIKFCVISKCFPEFYFDPHINTIKGSFSVAFCLYTAKNIRMSS